MVSENIKNLIKKFLIKIYRKIKALDAKESMNSFNSIKLKKRGGNSFFWGEKHFVSGAENLEIGENVHIGDNSYIRAEGGVIIGDNTHISRNFLLYSINHNYKGELIPYDSSMIYKPVNIGKNVWIGMNVCVAPGTTIGDGCIIGMGTTVSGTIPPLSIVGSAKCAIIGNRDEAHYSYLEKRKLYGGINGMLYGNSVIKEIGDIYFAKRSKSEIIQYKDRRALKKTFYDTTEGKEAFNTELSAYQIFGKYSWCPKIYEQTGNSLTIEFFPPSQRLDQLNSLEPIILEEILWCLLDIFNEGYAHCDFHAKNIYVTDNGIKVIDFETLRQQSKTIDFLESYDIIGEGIESPYATDNMCIFHKADISIAKLFNIKSITKLKELLCRRFKLEMLDASITFKTRRDNKIRHQLQRSNIYASFDLKHLKVGPKESQRNTAKRFSKFRISKNEIYGKSLLDIGSNIGGTLLGLAIYAPARMVGIEYDPDKVALSNKLAGYNNIYNVEFLSYDIESVLFEQEFIESFDVVFCLAVIEHLKDKERLFNILGRTCKQRLYFEGNANSDIDFIESGLRKAGFNKIEYLGFSDDEKNKANNLRPMFIAEK